MEAGQDCTGGVRAGGWTVRVECCRCRGRWELYMAPAQEVAHCLECRHMVVVAREDNWLARVEAGGGGTGVVCPDCAAGWVIPWRGRQALLGAIDHLARGGPALALVCRIGGVRAVFALMRGRRTTSLRQGGTALGRVKRKG
jgi:hypothetical protein